VEVADLEQRAHAASAGFQHRARCGASPRGGGSAAQRGSAAAQRGAKAQPVPRAPGGGTLPAIEGSLRLGGLAAGIVRSSACV
jgi:hypothetical protein